MDRLDLKLAPAVARLERILANNPDDRTAKSELALVNATELHRLNIEVARRDASTLDATTYSAQWTLKQSARTTFRLGAARTASTQQTIVTEPAVSEIANVAYAEQSSFTPGGLAWRWRGEYRHRPGQQNTYQAIVEASDALASSVRANASLTLIGPDQSTRRTVAGGLSYALAPRWESGITAFVSDGGTAATEKTLMARLSWSGERASAQAFLSRTIGQSSFRQTAVFTVPLERFVLRSQFQRDGVAKTNTWFVYLSVPLGKGVSAFLVRESLVADRSATVGLAADVPLPNSWVQ
jgi:hypothetical protein